MTKSIQFPREIICSLNIKRGTYTPWIKLARHRRKNDVVRLRGRISRMPETERFFYTDAYLPNDPRMPEDERAKHQRATWSDIVFPSRRYNDILYNCEVINFDTALSDYASERVFDEFPYPFEDKFKTVVAMHDKWGKPLTHKRIKPEGEDEWYAEARAREKEVILAGTEICEAISFDYDYRYGVGLYLKLNIHNLNLEGLKLAMERFFEHGESEWVGEPVFYKISDEMLKYWM